MELKELAARYRERAGEWGRPLHLSELGLPPEELERVLSAYDEDYQISRFFQLTRVPDPENHPRAGGQPLYTINGFAYSHLAILPEVETIL
ncbi:MAG: hypothetical protein ACE5IP_06835 [Terriglobia bacterium]